jgi:hypothetical protein
MTTTAPNPIQADRAATPPEPAPGFRTLTLLSGCVLAASALPVLYVTVFAGARMLWFSTLFELMVIAAAAIAILAARGRFRDGWALSLACVAGTVLVSAVFAAVEIRANFRDHPTIGRWIMPAAGFRVGMSAVFALIASLVVWNRNGKCWGLVIRAALALAPVAAALAWLAMGNVAMLNTPMPNPGAETLRIAALIIGGLLGVILVSAGGHLLIRSYEMGRPEAIARPEPSKG